MRRREILKQASAVATLGVAASLPFGLARMLAPARAIAGPYTQIPPPGALPDPDAFAEACIGCGLCGEVCPPRCILFHERDGGPRANTPYINPERRACTLCGLCMQACPTDALTVTPLEKIDMGIAQIDRAACYPWVDQGVCGACVSICPLGERAITFELWNQYRPSVQQGCVGCGLCVEVCPEPSLPIRVVRREEGTVMRHGSRQGRR